MPVRISLILYSRQSQRATKIPQGEKTGKGLRIHYFLLKLELGGKVADFCTTNGRYDDLVDSLGETLAPSGPPALLALYPDF